MKKSERLRLEEFRVAGFKAFGGEMVTSREDGAVGTVSGNTSAGASAGSAGVSAAAGARGESVSAGSTASASAGDSAPAGARVELGDITLLVGEHGAGKSCLLSFLDLVAAMMSDQLSSYAARSGGARGILHRGAVQAREVRGSLVFSAGRERGTYDFTLTGSGTGLRITGERLIGFEGEGMSEEGTSEERIWTNSGSRSALVRAAMGPSGDPAAAALVQLLRGCRVYHFRETSFRAGMCVPGYLYDSSALRADGGNLAAVLWRMRREGNVAALERIEETVRLVFPRFGGFVLEPMQMQGADPMILLQWRERDSGEVFDAWQLSDATLRFIALTALLLQPQKTLPALIVLDEPELGLSTRALQVLAGLLQECSGWAQILIATQEEALIDAFGAENVRLVRFDPGRRSSVVLRPQERELLPWSSV